MGQNTKPTRAAGEALAAYRIVKLSSNAFVYNDAADRTGIGVTSYAAASGESAALEPLNGPGTVLMTAAGAITNGARVFAAADGKVQALPVAAATYYQMGICCEAATADGDVIEVLPVGIGIAEVVT